jgi:hypothetical protein
MMTVPQNKNSSLYTHNQLFEFPLFASNVIYLKVLKKGIIIGVSKDNYAKLFSIETKKVLGGGTFVKKLENREPTCAEFYESQNELYIGTNLRLCLLYQYIEADMSFQFKSYIEIDQEDNSINSLHIFGNLLVATSGQIASTINLDSRPLKIVKRVI